MSDIRYNALYARQSIEKKDSISIESQLEYCRYEAHGEHCMEYTDKGFSGKDTNRPSFEKMMKDIRTGIIKRVIVYKLDRISRSILDFANMMELFQNFHVEFVSSTEKFDTSTPIGRAMLNICIVFAQLERETIQKRVTDKGLELRLNINPEMPDLIYGDEIRIKQVILNLLTNAVKYTEQGWIELSVNMTSASEYLDETDKVCLNVKVSDSGIGMEEEELPKLFVEFERLDRQRNKSIEGSGLGLSITSRLVQLMGGKILVESTYGEGSSFTVSIPQRVVSQEPIGDYKKRFESLSNESQQETQENAVYPEKKVFVVDDNEMNLEVIAAILEMLEIEVDRASSGASAIAFLDKNKVDLILTDDMMPEMSGTQMMEYLKSNKEGANYQTPIVVLTANAVVGAREEYINFGFDEYMTKPIDIDVLQKILMKYLK